MYMNGVGIGMVITVVVLRVIREVHHRALTVWVGVVAGTTVPVTAGLLFASAPVLASATASSASA